MAKKKTSSKMNRKIKLWSMILIIFATAFIFIYSSYAWFRATLRVRIDEFNINADSDADLEISLDGINWGSSVTINKATVINELSKVYETHHNCWPGDGLWAVSSIGNPNIYSNSFELYTNTNKIERKKDVEKVYNDYQLDLELLDDSKRTTDSQYLAFDIFLRNGTPSPLGDYLYIKDTSFVETNDEVDKHNENIDSIRIGFSITPINEIQRLSCGSGCINVIYEPNSTSHVPKAIYEASRHGINDVEDGKYYNTYAVARPGRGVFIWSGVKNSAKPFDDIHFKLQETVTSEKQPITILHEGILKMRVFVWVEAQDIDTIERINLQDTANISVNFKKEMIK